MLMLLPDAILRVWLKQKELINKIVKSSLRILNLLKLIKYTLMKEKEFSQMFLLLLIMIFWPKPY